MAINGRIEHTEVEIDYFQSLMLSVFDKISEKAFFSHAERKFYLYFVLAFIL